MGEALYPKGDIQVLCTDMKLSTSTIMLNTQMAYAMIFDKILIKSDQILIIYIKTHHFLEIEKSNVKKLPGSGYWGIGVLGGEWGIYFWGVLGGIN